MIQANDIIIYNGEKYNVLSVSDSGYCEIQKLNDTKYVELVHRKEIQCSTRVNL